jgi:hypothetical protein
VRPQPVWRLRTERVAAAVALAAIFLVLVLAAVQREAPYKVISKPLQERIHLGKESEGPVASEAQAIVPVQPVAATDSAP